eukprot:scaffold666_cov332-Prasinococcus_capsulatus_cf.AAC.4
MRFLRSRRRYTLLPFYAAPRSGGEMAAAMLAQVRKKLARKSPGPARRRLAERGRQRCQQQEPRGASAAARHHPRPTLAAACGALPAASFLPRRARFAECARALVVGQPPRALPARRAARRGEARPVSARAPPPPPPRFLPAR